MISKTTLFTTLIMTAAIFSHVHAKDQTNVCDKLKKQGMAQSAVDRCIEQEGKSEAYTKDEEKKLKTEKKKEEEAQAAKERAENFIEEKFDSSSEKFTDISYGSSIVAKRIYYKDGKYDKEETLTTGEDVCKALGFQKATHISLSKEIRAYKATKEGNTISIKAETGEVSKTLFSDPDEKGMHMIRVIDSISCKKVKSNDIPGMEEELKKIKEAVSFADGGKKTKKDDDEDEVDNRSRSVDDGKVTTPHGCISTHEENKNGKAHGQ